MSRRKVAKIVILWMLMFGILSPAINVKAAPKWQGGSPIEEDVFHGEFSLTPDPLLNQPAQLTFTIAPIVGFSSAEIKLFLPEGVALDQGSLTWQGETTRYRRKSLSVTVTVESRGEHRIRAYVGGETSNGLRRDRSYFLFISATDTEARLNCRPQNVKHPQNDLEQIPRRLEEGVQNGINFTSTGVTVTGRWQYEDDSGALHPIRHAKVKIYNDGLIDTELGSGYTDDSGNYSFEIDVSGTRNVYVKIWTDSTAAKVTAGNPYWGQTNTQKVLESDPSTWNLGSYYFEANHANWQAMDYVLDEYIWLNDQVGWTRSQVEIEWPKEYWPHSHGNSIHLPDKAIADWDRLTVLHEYGHCVMYAAYGYSWPPGSGGSHAIWTENIGLSNGTLVPGNGGFAINEGWAEFMEAAIDNDAGNLNALSPQGDLDGDSTWGTASLQFINGSWGIVWNDHDDARLKNVENNEWWMGENYQPDNLGSIVEGAVASILWDVFDERNDDNLYEGFDEIWSVILGDNPDDIVEFRTHYLNDNPTHENGLCSIFDNHGIPCFNILSPVEVAPAYAGSSSTPSKAIVEVVTDYGLQKDDFIVRIGNRDATIVTVYEAKGTYSLEVIPPIQSANGLYNLQVTAGSRTDAEVNAIYYADTNNVDASLVLDRSGSMSGQKIMDAKNAAQQFVTQMVNGDMVGIVSYSSDATINYPLTTITGTVKTEASNAIDSLSSGGSTSIGGGLQTGQDQLATDGKAPPPWAIVLLSDGLENTAPYVAEVLPNIVSSKTVVHTVGLGSGADEALMMDIAAQTGGTYHFAPSSQDLSGIYNTIAGRVSGQQTLVNATGVTQQGMSDQINAIVDSTVSEATFSVSWSDSSSTISLTLQKPNGTLVTPSTASSDLNVDYAAGSTYTFYKIKPPTLTTGVWKMQITGGSISTAAGQETTVTADGEPYIARVTGIAGLTMRFYLGRDDYLTTEPVKLVVTLSDNQPIQGAAVTVEVEPPSQAAQAIRSSEWIEINGDMAPDPAKIAEIEAEYAQTTVSTVTLYDDGTHDDGAANNGVYANSFSGAFESGTYLFSASATGTSNSSEMFARQADLSTYIAQNPHPLTFVYLPLILGNHSGPGWSSATGLAGRTVYALACDLADCTTRYAGADDGVYKSTDTGSTWSASGLSGMMVTSIAADPTAPRTLYAATWGQGAYKSINGGDSWNQINSGLNGKHWLYAVVVASDGSLYAGTYDGGLYKSTNDGASWSPVNDGLGNLNVRSLTVDPNNAQVLYVGTTDGVYKSTDGGDSWSAASSGMSGREVRVLVVDPSDSATVFSGTDSGIYRSTSDGEAWTRVGLTGREVYALTIDPLDTRHIYAGANGSGVHHSADGGNTWTAMNTGLGNLIVEALTLDGDSCRTLQAGTYDGTWMYSD